MQNKYNVLVLDEPTNHLDIYAKEELSRALREFKGTIVLVSHEPEFYKDWGYGYLEYWRLDDKDRLGGPMNQRAKDGIKQFLEALSVWYKGTRARENTKSCNRII